MEKLSTTRNLIDLWKSPRFQIIAGIVAVLAFALIHQLYLLRAHPDALYMDSLRLLFQLEQWESGQLSTIDFWGQGSSHRGFVNQLFLLANVSLFDLDVMLINRLTGVVIAAVALILILAWCRDNRRQLDSFGDALMVAGVSVTMAGLCYSWAGFELFTLDLGLPLWVKNLCFVSFFCLHAWLLSGESKRPMLWSIVLALWAPVVVLVAGMGWNYSFIGAVLALQALAFIPAWRASSRWYGVLPCVSLLAAFGVYLTFGTVVDAAVSIDTLDIADTPLITLYALGSTIGNPAAITQTLPVWVIAVAGGGMLVTGLIASLSWLRRGAPGSRLPLYLILYGALVAVSVTIARGADGPGGVMASRYYMDLVLGLIGVIWITTRELRSVGAARGSVKTPLILIWTMLVAVGVLHLGTYYYEWRAGPYRALAFADMNRALLNSVPDENSAALLQSPIAHARKGAEIMRERQLSIFEGHPEMQCSTEDVDYGRGWHKPEAQGRWLTTLGELSLPSTCSCDFVATMYVPGVFHARRIEVRRDDKAVSQATLLPGKTTTVELGKAGSKSILTLVAAPDPDQTPAAAGTADEPELGALLTGFSVRCSVP